MTGSRIIAPDWVPTSTVNMEDAGYLGEWQYAAKLTDPKVRDADQEPDDDIEAEVPDVREDTVPDDPA